jgi:hypothetical protein
MDYEREIMDIGSQFGGEAAEHIAQRAEDYCDCERQRIELSNQAQINALNVEGVRLTKRERQIEERLRLAAPPGDTRGQKRKARFYWFVGTLLTVAAFFFSLVAFEPYRLGWYGDLYCLGIAVATPFTIEVFLDAWKNERLLKAIVTVVFLAALAGGAVLAAIRGDLLAQQVQQQSTPAVVIDGENPSPPQPQNSFYDSTHGSLRILMLLLALAIDLGAGVAVHRALVLGAASGEDFEKLSQELAGTQERIGAIVFEITALANAPGIFVARFWRDYYRALLTQTLRKAATKLLGIAICLLLLGVGQALGQNRLQLVVAVDLSASVAVADHNGKTEFEKNLAAVGQLLATVPLGSHVTILGITDDSFSQPYILLSANVAEDAGYFGEKIATARQQLVRAWQERSVHLSARARHTDILGALVIAGQLLSQSPESKRRILVLYSDMQQSTGQLNLEANTPIAVETALRKAAQDKSLTELKGVEVYALGVDAARGEMRQWDRARQFWAAYLAAMGATLKSYSILREPLMFKERP